MTYDKGQIINSACKSVLKERTFNPAPKERYPVQPMMYQSIRHDVKKLVRLFFDQNNLKEEVTDDEVDGQLDKIGYYSQEPFEIENDVFPVRPEGLLKQIEKLEPGKDEKQPSGPEVEKEEKSNMARESLENISKAFQILEVRFEPKEGGRKFIVTTVMEIQNPIPYLVRIEKEAQE